MKPRFLIALALAAGSLLPMAPVSAHGQRLSIEVGDRPYYNRGAYYWERGHRWCWVRGHRNRWGRWIHGHYRPCR